MDHDSKLPPRLWIAGADGSVAVYEVRTAFD